MNLTIGFSPCPNDTFIFDALIHQRIDTEGLTFDPVLADVEQLNQWAFAGRLDITKLSFHAFGHVTDRYALLHSGAALGRNCGPMLIAKVKHDLKNIAALKIAIPGKYTTANFLLSAAFPKGTQKTEVLFSEIENRVLDESFDAGLIIHENRFTYQDKGLVKLIDLGEWWEQTHHAPIPLGGIAVNRELDDDVQQKINRVLRRSVEFAFANPHASATYVAEHAQEMEPAVVQKHINLYVNDFSIDLGGEGRGAIEQLFKIARELRIIPKGHSKLFINYTDL